MKEQQELTIPCTGRSWGENSWDWVLSCSLKGTGKQCWGSSRLRMKGTSGDTRFTTQPGCSSLP
jgi:hypothetical protein